MVILPTRGPNKNRHPRDVILRRVTVRTGGATVRSGWRYISVERFGWRAVVRGLACYDYGRCRWSSQPGVRASGATGRFVLPYLRFTARAAAVLVPADRLARGAATTNDRAGIASGTAAGGTASSRWSAARGTAVGASSDGGACRAATDRAANGSDPGTSSCSCRGAARGSRRAAASSLRSWRSAASSPGPRWAAASGLGSWRSAASGHPGSWRSAAAGSADDAASGADRDFAGGFRGPADRATAAGAGHAAAGHAAGGRDDGATRCGATAPGRRDGSRAGATRARVTRVRAADGAGRCDGAAAGLRAVGLLVRTAASAAVGGIGARPARAAGLDRAAASTGAWLVHRARTARRHAGRPVHQRVRQHRPGATRVTAHRAARRTPAGARARP